jgi:hypothetical protein
LVYYIKEKHTHRNLENRVLKSIFGPKRDEVMEERRKLLSGEILNLFSSPENIRQIKSRRLRWAGHVARMGVMKKCTRFFFGNTERKSTFGRPKSRWENGTKNDFMKIGRKAVQYIHLSQDRDWWKFLINTVTKLRVLAPLSS